MSALFTRDQIGKRVSELGRQIGDDYRGMDPFVLVVLNGAFVFAADLVRAIPICDLEIGFVGLKSYAKTTQGTIVFTMHPPDGVIGRDVLVVEDIVDTGETIRVLTDRLKSKFPRSVEVVALLHKRRPGAYQPRYVGFDAPDNFVVGYGLDVAGRNRHLADIMAT